MSEWHCEERKTTAIDLSSIDDETLVEEVSSRLEQRDKTISSNNAFYRENMKGKELELNDALRRNRWLESSSELTKQSIYFLFFLLCLSIAVNGGLVWMINQMK